ncbi:MAG: Rieske 2Fe-2S domain-containing protein, partial [Hyphomicrobiaceae bacterium]
MATGALPKPCWQAVALARDVGRKPVRVMFEGRPVVLFRNSNGVQALFDRCPHRLVELSKGRLVGND